VRQPYVAPRNDAMLCAITVKVTVEAFGSQEMCMVVTFFWSILKNASIILKNDS